MPWRLSSGCWRRWRSWKGRKREGEVGSRNSEFGRGKGEGEIGSRKSEVGRRKAEGGRRKGEVGSRKGEGGRGKALSVKKANFGVMGSKIKIVPYDPGWAEAFEREYRQLEARLAPVLVSVEHIGSTAVEGLGSKPIIDILIGIDGQEALNSVAAPLLDMGYCYYPCYEVKIPERRFFARLPALQRQVFEDLLDKPGIARLAEKAAREIDCRLHTLERFDMQFLRHQADKAARSAEIGKNVVSADAHRARAWVHQPADDRNQRCLAGAVWPKKREYLAFLDIQAYGIERFQSARIGFGKFGNGDDRLHDRCLKRMKRRETEFG